MSTEPKRIQQKRTKGWRLPENTVCVGRPSKFGNMYHVPRDGTAAECVRKFRATFEDSLTRLYAKEHLRGKDLACWCPLVDENGDKVPCHADVLLEWANAD